MVGDGSRMQGPLRRPRVAEHRKARDAGGPPVSSAPAPRARPKRPAAPLVVAVADLSRPPQPPALGGLLLANYPLDARRRGVAGRAVVRARVDPDGKVRQANIASESEPGFGAACRATVLGSTWTPPLDREGKAVATRISYTCRFQVAR